jgi:hypothetical protein
MRTPQSPRSRVGTVRTGYCMRIGIKAEFLGVLHCVATSWPRLFTSSDGKPPDSTFDALPLFRGYSSQRKIVMVEQCLQRMIDAADRDDDDDVAIRRLLATALSDSGLDLAQMMNGRIPSVLTSCERGAAWRVSVMRSPLRRRCSPLVAGRSSRRWCCGANA